MKQRLFILFQYLLPHHLLSRLAGCVAECRVRWFKNAFTQWFVRRYQVDMSLALVEDVTAYPHFNDFFTRALKPGARPLDETPGAILCPADGAVSQLGPIEIPFKTWESVEQNAFFCPDPDKVPELEAYMDQLRRDQDSVGAKITVVAEGVMPGLGEPIFDRLDAELAHALMSINAVKGIEIGAGFDSIAQHGTEHRDELTPQGFLSNNAGGILGGISSGQPIVAHLALKPTSSITVPGRSIDVNGNAVEMITKGRHDPCVGIRATPIAEAMMAIVLLDHLLRHRGQNQDVRVTTPVLGQL